MKFSTNVTQSDYNEFKKYYKTIEYNEKFKITDDLVIRKIAFPALNLLIFAILYFLFKKIFHNYFSDTINIECIIVNFKILTLIGIPLISINFIIFRYLTKIKIFQLENGPEIGRHEYIISNFHITNKINGHIFISRINEILSIIETYNNIFILIDYNSAYIINKNSIRSKENSATIITAIMNLAKKQPSKISKQL